MTSSYEHYVARAEAIAAHWASRVEGVDWSELRRQILDLLYEETAAAVDGRKREREAYQQEIATLRARVAELEAALEQAAAMPQPDWLTKFPPEWDRHPWANWACLIVLHGGIDGVTLRWNYFEVKPEWGEKSYNWVDGTHGFANPVTRAPLSLFFDTKDTLTQRPADGAND